MPLAWGAQPITRRFPAKNPKIRVLKACIHTPTSLSLLSTPRGRSCESNRRVVLDFNIWCIGLACLELVFHRLPAKGMAGRNQLLSWPEVDGKGSSSSTQSKAWSCSCVTHPQRDWVTPQIPDKHLECGSWARVAREEKGRGANHCMNFSS